MSKGHKHAVMMAEYARIAAEHEEPWVFFQHRLEGGEEWLDCSNNVAWVVCNEYRLKPRTIRIGEIDVPMPEKTEPKHGAAYFFPVVKGNGHLSVIDCWEGREDQKITLRRGLLHLSNEAAYIHAKALILVSGGKV